MAKASDNQYPKVTFLESSAPSTPASTLGFAYEKTDGKLYFKNDGGTEYDLTAGATGASVGATSQRISRTSGSLTLTGSTTTHAEISSALRLTIAAATGDILLGGMTGLATGGANGEAALDIATIVSGAIVNRFAGGGSRIGMSYPAISAGGTGPIAATLTYAVQAGDISGGNVVVSPSYIQAGAGNGSLLATTTYALVFWVLNLGH